MAMPAMVTTGSATKKRRCIPAKVSAPAPLLLTAWESERLIDPLRRLLSLIEELYHVPHLERVLKRASADSRDGVGKDGDARAGADGVGGGGGGGGGQRPQSYLAGRVQGLT